jgi:hypothetical protein
MLVAEARSTFPLKTQNLSGISLSGFLDLRDPISQVIGIAFTLSDIADTGSRKGVVKLRVLTCWRQPAADRFLLAQKPI